MQGVAEVSVAGSEQPALRVRIDPARLDDPLSPEQLSRARATGGDPRAVRALEKHYDPEEGDPDRGIPPGTPFEDIPDDWMCPVCGARKRDFREMKPGEEIPDDVN